MTSDDGRPFEISHARNFLVALRIADALLAAYLGPVHPVRAGLATLKKEGEERLAALKKLPAAPRLDAPPIVTD